MSKLGSLELLGRKVRRAASLAALLSLAILFCFSAKPFIIGQTSNLLLLLGDSKGRGPSRGALFSFSVDLRRWASEPCLDSGWACCCCGRLAEAGAVGLRNESESLSAASEVRWYLVRARLSAWRGWVSVCLQLHGVIGEAHSQRPTPRNPCDGFPCRIPLESA